MKFSSPSAIQEHFRSSVYTAQFLYRRGFRDEASITQFIKPKLADLPMTADFRDLGSAAEFLWSSLEKGLKIGIYADFDVDGTCAAALLATYLHELGYLLGQSVFVFQPSRFREGYGFHSSGVQALKDLGATVIIALDCGSVAYDTAQYCRDHNLPLIILDHHLYESREPSAQFFINPQKPGQPENIRQFCTGALSFFLVRALWEVCKNQGPRPSDFLDFSALATVADVMPLDQSQNRALVKYGLDLIARKPRPWLQALQEVSGSSIVSAQDFGFTVAPRINAAGRLEEARLAFDLMMSSDLSSARIKAAQLEALNVRRKEIQSSVYTDAFAKAQTLMTNSQSLKALVLAHENWHEGVLGIVATKIMEDFNLPALILSQSHGVWKGSLRSPKGIRFLEACQALGSLLIQAGGHSQAAGVRLSLENLDVFTKALQELSWDLFQEQGISSKPHSVDGQFDIEIKAEKLNTSELETYLREINSFGPFGSGFPEPKFCIQGRVVSDYKVLKSLHEKFSMGGIPFIRFGKAQSQPIVPGKTYSVVASAQWNHFRGRQTPQFQVSQIYAAEL